MNNNPLLSWQAMLIKLLLFAVVSVGLQRPVGSIVGSLSLEKKGFGLQSYDIRGNKVYVTASGPRGEPYDERGVWVKPDGSFRLDHLPKGEYSLKFHATGYSTEYQNGVFVDDGKITDLAKPVSLYILHPSVQVASNRKVFTSKECPHFWANCTGTKEVTVKLYKTDMLKLRDKTLAEEAAHPSETAEDGNRPFAFGSNLELYKGTEARYPANFAKQKPVHVFTRELLVTGDDWANAQFKMDRPLALGEYVGLAEAKSATGETDWNLFWFSVSDLGLIVKQDRQQCFVRAIDLNTLKPVPHAGIRLSGEVGEAVYTGADGFVTAKTASLGMVIGTMGQSRAYGNIWTSGEESGSGTYKTYFYTERPVYRLGQTVYFKGLTRILGGNGLRTPAKGLAVSAVIEDPQNNKVWNGSFRTNAHGCFNGLYKVPEDGHTGGYQLVLTYPNGNKDYESFEVSEYRKPEYEVSITPLQERVIAGNKLKARLKASYYFGAPVSNARVKYSVYAADDYGNRLRLLPRPSYYSYFDDWESDDSDSWRTYSYGGDYISEGTAQTDATGEALIEIDTKKLVPPGPNPYDAAYQDKKYTIEAEVTDLSRMSVVGSGSCSVVAGSFALFVETQNYVVLAGQPLSVTVSALDYEGKPIINQSATVKLQRRIYDQSKSEYVGWESAGTVNITTDHQGKAICVFNTKNSLPTDTYVVTAEASDSLGDNIYDQTGLWIASENYPYVRSGDEAKKQTLSVKLDKPVYKPGDIAHAMITAPVSGTEGAEAIVAIEGTKLQKYWTVPMNATAKLVDIPIQSSYEPNAYVTVTFIGLDHQFYNESRVIRVSPQEHFLNLSIATDKDRYSPGDMVKYTITAKDAAGRPVPNTELSLGLVDESIYSIRAENTPNIQKFFYGRRSNWVTTTCSFGEEYSGGPDKVQVQVRKDFRDTAAWLPELNTDKNGIATASIKLPDNLTTWRATVRGITMGTDVGAVINKIVSTKDLIVRLAMPRFFSHGDETFVSAVVHNYTKKTQSIDLSVSLSPQFEVHEKTLQKLTILPDKAQRFSWPVKITGSGLATVSVKAIGQTAGDAMELKVPVLALGIPGFSIKSGMLLDDPASVSIPIAIPATVCPGTLKYHLGVSASSIGPVLGSFDNLIHYPYGCTEQTMSRLMPSVVAMSLHKGLGIPIKQDTSKLFAKVYKAALRKLYDYQHQDGGWGWWETDDSSVYLTPLVLDGFAKLKEVGYQIDQNRIKKGLAWMSKATGELCDQLASPQHKVEVYLDRERTTDLAKMVYTLTIYKSKPSKKVVDWLVSRKRQMAPEGLCYTIMALKKIGDHRWNDCYERLLSFANQTNEFTDWDHTAAFLKRLGFSDLNYDYDYRFTGVETTALALRTVLAVDPENRDLIEKTKSWLLLQHDNNGWENTKTTSEVFRALLEEQLAFNRTAPGATNLTVELADKFLNNLVFDQTNSYSPETQIAMPTLTAPETITLKKSGPGRIYYNSLATYTQKILPTDKITAQCVPAGLSLERSFFRLTPSAKTSDGTMHFRSDRITDNNIRAGETVLMKVQVNTPVALPYVVLEAYLPSGAEVVDDRSKSQNVQSGDSNMAGDWSNWWWTHQDVLDDRIVFFVTHLPAGECKFSTLLRFEMPGSYHINPLRIEGMYAKNVRGYSTLDGIKVTE